MTHNVHGHKMPEPFRTNEDNPIFQRHQPEYVPAEVPAGLHGAPALRSELTTTVETEVGPVTMPTDPASVESVEAAMNAGEPSSADLDAVAEEQETAEETISAVDEEETEEKTAEDTPFTF